MGWRSRGIRYSTLKITFTPDGILFLTKTFLLFVRIISYLVFGTFQNMRKSEKKKKLYHDTTTAYIRVYTILQNIVQNDQSSE